MPADAVSHGLCDDCREQINKQSRADAGNKAGSASSPGPASHDTAAAHHRRPGEPLPEIVTSVTPEGIAGTWEIQRDAAGRQTGRRAVTAEERRALTAPGAVEV